MPRFHVGFFIVPLGLLALACDPGDPAACDPFADRIASFTFGPNAGLGQDRLPDVVLGRPVGGGATVGGTDVLSLGTGGEIVLELAGPGITDGPGADLLVFENAFYVGGDPAQPYAELAAVSVSDDGIDFVEFACASAEWPYTGCAGWHAVLASPDNGVDPTDPDAAGGDPFDLADVGLSSARFVRIRDLSPGPGGAPPSAGFDLDAVAAVHGCD